MKIEEAIQLLHDAVVAAAHTGYYTERSVQAEMAEGEEAINTVLAWNTTGHHVDLPVGLEFSEATDESGLPLYERLVEYGNE